MIALLCMGGSNLSIDRRVLNLMEAIYLRHQKIVVQGVTVVKFGVDNTGTYTVS